MLAVSLLEDSRPFDGNPVASARKLRKIRARNPAERATLGDYFLVDAHKRHIIVRDHVDLDRFADEIGAWQSEENLGASQGTP